MTQTFRAISESLAARCMTFDKAKDVLNEQQQQIQDIRAPLSDWLVAPTDTGIVFEYRKTGQQFTPTKHALNLMCNVGRGMSSWAVNSMLAPIGHATKKDNDGDPITIEGGERTRIDFQVLCHYINVHLFHPQRVDQTKPRLFRTWTNGTLRAMLSNQYAIINNEWFINQLQRLVPDGLFCHWRGDADSIYANLLIPDTMYPADDSDLGGMLSIGNSEIGVRRMSTTPSVFRAICMNGVIYDQQKGAIYSKVHRGQIDLNSLRLGIEHNLDVQLPMLTNGIQQLLATKAYSTDNVPMANMLAATASRYTMSKKQTKSVWTEWAKEINILGPKEGKSAFGLISGMTRAGQNLSNHDWVRFDTAAGDIMNMSRNHWDKFVTVARNLSEKQVAKRVAIAV